MKVWDTVVLIVLSSIRLLGVALDIDPNHLLYLGGCAAEKVPVVPGAGMLVPRFHALRWDCKGAFEG